MVHNVIILGAGPAGYTAALYAARANLKPLLFEGNQPGGQLTITTEVENYPGFPHGVMGPELMVKFKEQCARFGTEFVEFRNVTKLDAGRRPFVVTDEEGQTYEAHTVIVATGARAKLLGLPKERELMGFGVSACATCDGAFFKEKEVVVVGGGDTAMEEANFLTRYCTRVTVVHRRDQFRASAVMLERARANPKIAWKTFRELVDFEHNEKKQVTAVQLKDSRSGALERFATQGVFIAIGHQPNTEFLGPEFRKDGVGYLIAGPGTRTSVEGVFAAGDVADAVYRQAVTAAGTGCAAALDAQRYLEHHGIA